MEGVALAVLKAAWDFLSPVVGTVAAEYIVWRFRERRTADGEAPLGAVL